jgi:hypothetical protein
MAKNSGKNSGAKKAPIGAGIWLLLGVVVSAMTGQWWFIGVGLVIGAGVGAIAAR